MTNKTTHETIDQIGDLYEGIKDATNSLVILPESHRDTPPLFNKLKDLRDVACVLAKNQMIENDFCRIIELPEVKSRALLVIGNTNNHEKFEISLKYDLNGVYVTTKLVDYKTKEEAVKVMNSFKVEDAVFYYNKLKGATIN